MIGSTIAHYKVTAKLGAGGMGEVYRATDTKLNRDVALKVLPAAFAADAQRMARFQREAQVLASLNHPNIAAIYGLEQAERSPVLAMELVEGLTLAERIARGALPLEEALSLARQITEGVEYAHEKGIIHRDLKPANIKLTAEGNVKVLDFGLAKALAEEASETEPANSPTLSMAATKAGIILGTAAYMSPEQARGKVVDRRSDVWSFGVVLFEMLAGQRAFAGEDASETLAAVLRADLNWQALPEKTPRAIRRLLERCLERNPKRRLQSIGEARIALEDALSGVGQETPVEPAAAQAAGIIRFVPWLVAGALLVIASVLGWQLQSSTAPEPPPTSRFRISLPASERLAAVSSETDSIVAISPDGRLLAYGVLYDGHSRIELRPVDALESRPLPNTEGARGIFFSPDGKWLGFAAGGRLKKVSLAGGSPIEIAGSEWGGGVWTKEDVIYYTPHYSSGLVRVSANGGKPEKLTEPDRQAGELGHWWPDLLPDGQTLIFTAFRAPVSRARVMALSLATGKQTVLFEGGSFARYLPTGHLIFMREEGLMAVSFDPKRLLVTGAPVRVLEDAYLDPQDGLSFLAVSRNGTLVYVPKSALKSTNEVLWLDRQGKGQALPLPKNDYQHPRLSPDGSRLSITTAPLQKQDVWIWDVNRNSMTSIAAGPTSEFNALWTTDGKRLIYNLEETQFKIHVRPADGTGQATLLHGSTFDTIPSAISKDGKYILFNENTETQADIWVMLLDGSSKPVPYLKTPAAEEMAVFSPDSRWVAYQSSVSGRNEIYVQGFPESGERFQISTQGGFGPTWSSKGNEIYYRVGASMMAVPVETRTGFRAGKPQELFRGEFDNSFPGPNYEATPDGRFLMIRTSPESAPRTMVVVVNWFEELKRLVPAGSK